MESLKRSLAIFFSILVFGLLYIGNANEVKAYTAHNQDEAIAWVSSLVGQSFDADNFAGAQCVDLILIYYDYLGVPRSSGNGCDYASNRLPAGWTRVQGGTPQKGDILVFSGNSNNPYGHVAIYESEYSTYHQNFDGKNWKKYYLRIRAYKYIDGRKVYSSWSSAKKCKWSSSNKRVAAVNSRGKVTAKKVGSAKIKAKYGKKSKTCKVVVKQRNSNNISNKYSYDKGYNYYNSKSDKDINNKNNSNSHNNGDSSINVNKKK